jgi:hypothetical protein
MVDITLDLIVLPLLLLFYVSFFLFIHHFLLFFVFQFFYCPPLSVWFFIALPFSPLLFHLYFFSVFRLLWVSPLAYRILFGTKRLGCCCHIL